MGAMRQPEAAMVSNMRRFAIAVLLVALFPWHAEANGNLSIRVAPGAMIPIGSSADLYAFSGTVMLAGEYQLPFLPWLYATTTAGYAFAQTTTATPLTLVPAAFGGGLKPRSSRKGQIIKKSV